MDAVRFTLRDDIALLTLDDGKANALSPDLLNAIHGALDRAEKEAAAVALVGRPGRFCAGFDLKVMRGGPEAARELVTLGGQTFLRFLEYPLPIVVGCTGHALAAGAIALLVADYRVGARGAFQIGLNETAIGMTLPAYGTEFARERLSKRHFDRAVIQAELYDPDGALDAGYLDRLELPEAVEGVALEEAGRLATLPKASFRNNKRRAHAEVVARVRDGLVEDVRSLLSP
jgi:enoyl-CoA hydratase